MINGELTNAQRAAAQYEELARRCEESPESGAGFILTRMLPSGSHGVKLRALPDCLINLHAHLQAAAGSAAFYEPAQYQAGFTPPAEVIPAMQRAIFAQGHDKIGEAVLKAHRFLKVG